MPGEMTRTTITGSPVRSGDDPTQRCWVCGAFGNDIYCPKHKSDLVQSLVKDPEFISEIIEEIRMLNNKARGDKNGTGKSE